jgi:demethylmenaquinone methyltransferase / 2-methoxy-6-polyprenyl-1,4-benzoquinol methylase
MVAPAKGVSSMRQAAQPRDVNFGFRTVPLASKQQLVDAVFDTVARRYDLMNDLMSFGLHRAWKDVVTVALDPPRGARRFALADVAGGTGDIAFRAVAAGGAKTRVTVIDPNHEMLNVGRARARARGLADAVTFVEGRAEGLPLKDRSQDAVSVAFGLRNVPQLDAALTEAFRVLRIGGHFVALEFSTCDVPGLDWLYDLYSFQVIPALGGVVVGDREPYRYLVESIRRFPGPEALAAMMTAAGFGRVSYRALSGGIVALHSGWRL